MIIVTKEDDRERRQHFTVDTLQEDTVIKSLILAVDQRQPGAHVTLYIDCTSYGMIATPRSMRDMFNNMDDPQVLLVSRCMRSLIKTTKSYAKTLIADAKLI